MALVQTGRWTSTDVIDVRLRRRRRCGSRARPRSRRRRRASRRRGRLRGPGPRRPQAGLPPGSSDAAHRLRPDRGPGAACSSGNIARLCFADPLPLHAGDRLLLRDPGAAQPPRRRLAPAPAPAAPGQAARPGPADSAARPGPGAAHAGPGTPGAVPTPARWPSRITGRTPPRPARPALAGRACWAPWSWTSCRRGWPRRGAAAAATGSWGAGPISPAPSNCWAGMACCGPARCWRWASASCLSRSPASGSPIRRAGTALAHELGEVLAAHAAAEPLAAGPAGRGRARRARPARPAAGYRARPAAVPGLRRAGPADPRRRWPGLLGAARAGGGRAPHPAGRPGRDPVRGSRRRPAAQAGPGRAGNRGRARAGLLLRISDQIVLAPGADRAAARSWPPCRSRSPRPRRARRCARRGERRSRCWSTWTGGRHRAAAR